MARKARKVRCIETGEVFDSCIEAGRKLGLPKSAVSKIIRGTQKSAKGLHFEVVEEEEEKEEEQMISCITNEQGEPVPVIDSREVARMMGKPHRDIIDYIEGKGEKVTGILSVIEQHFGKCSTSMFFIESSYYSKDYRKCKCYLCTKKGCELLGNKQQGEKGILFSIAYVERFNEMEEELKSKSEHKYPELTEKQQCILAIYDGGESAVTASKRLAEIEVQEATALLKEELTQSKAELTEKTGFIDNINDCYTFTQVKQHNKQLLRDRKDIVLSTAKLNEVAAELGIPVNKIDNPIEYSPYRRVNAYPRKVWEKAYPDIKLPEKPDIKLPEKKESK